MEMILVGKRSLFHELKEKQKKQDLSESEKKPERGVHFVCTIDTTELISAIASSPEPKAMVKSVYKVVEEAALVNGIYVNNTGNRTSVCCQDTRIEKLCGHIIMNQFRRRPIERYKTKSLHELYPGQIIPKCRPLNMSPFSGVLHCVLTAQPPVAADSASTSTQLCMFGGEHSESSVLPESVKKLQDFNLAESTRKIMQKLDFMSKKGASKKTLVFLAENNEILGRSMDDVIISIKEALSEMDAENKPEKILFLLDSQLSFEHFNIIMHKHFNGILHKDFRIMLQKQFYAYTKQDEDFEIKTKKYLADLGKEKNKYYLNLHDANSAVSAIELFNKVSSFLIDSSRCLYQNALEKMGGGDYDDSWRMLYDVIGLIKECEIVSKLSSNNSKFLLSMAHLPLLREITRNTFVIIMTLWRIIRFLNSKLSSDAVIWKYIILLKGFYCLVAGTWSDSNFLRLRNNESIDEMMKNIIGEVISSVFTIVRVSNFVIAENALVARTDDIESWKTDSKLLFVPRESLPVSIVFADIVKLILVIVDHVVIGEDVKPLDQGSKSWKYRLLGALIEQLADAVCKHVSLLESDKASENMLNGMKALHTAYISIDVEERPKIREKLEKGIREIIKLRVSRQQAADSKPAEKIEFVLGDEKFTVFSKNISLIESLNKYIECHAVLVKSKGEKEREQALNNCYGNLGKVVNNIIDKMSFTPDELNSIMDVFLKIVNDLFIDYHFSKDIKTTKPTELAKEEVEVVDNIFKILKFLSKRIKKSKESSSLLLAIYRKLLRSLHESREVYIQFEWFKIIGFFVEHIRYAILDSKCFESILYLCDVVRGLSIIQFLASTSDYAATKRLGVKFQERRINILYSFVYEWNKNYSTAAVNNMAISDLKKTVCELRLIRKKIADSITLQHVKGMPSLKKEFYDLEQRFTQSHTLKVNELFDLL